MNPGTPRPCRQFRAALLADLVIAVAGAYALGLRNTYEGDSCDSTTWVVFGCVSILGGLLIMAGGLYAGLTRDE